MLLAEGRRGKINCGSISLTKQQIGMVNTQVTVAHNISILDNLSPPPLLSEMNFFKKMERYRCINIYIQLLYCKANSSSMLK